MISKFNQYLINIYYTNRIRNDFIFTVLILIIALIFSYLLELILYKYFLLLWNEIFVIILIYIISAIFLGYLLKLYNGFFKIKSSIIRFTNIEYKNLINFEAVVVATTLTCVFHLILYYYITSFLLIPIDILFLRFLGFVIDLYILQEFIYIFLNIHIFCNIRDFFTYHDYNIKPVSLSVFEKIKIKK